MKKRLAEEQGEQRIFMTCGSTAGLENWLGEKIFCLNQALVR